MSHQWNEPDDHLPEKGLALEQEAAMHFESGNLWKARSLQRQAMQIWKTCDFPEREAQSAQVVGYLCFRLNDHGAAITAYERAAEMRTQLGDHSGMAISQARLAEVHQHLGNHKKAISLLTKTLSYWRRGSHRKELGVTFNNLGVSLSALGERSTAKHYYEMGLTIRREIGDQEGLAASLHNLGSLALDEGEVHDARRYLEEAASIRRLMGAKAGLGRTLLHLGLLHEQEQNLPLAIDYYEQAWEMAVDPEVNDPNDEAAALHNLGVTATASGDPARGLRLLQQAQAILEKTGKTHGLALSHYHSGLAHHRLGEVEKAMKHFIEAKNLQKQIDDGSGLAATFVAIAAVLSEFGLFPPAYDMLVMANKLQQQLCEDQAQFHTLRLLAQVCEMQGRQEEAMRYKRMAYPESLQQLLHTESI